eukprot:TRINITY_DN1912_c0_g2_i1.p1 TRINITY_DN1912_c0_g2~~TRINITY_DN1912_c0_g2_i1.p1  ORF type:complete len:570 (-),score=112.14 TRINITY_DN1912_c0_g2_i1:288-1997(-)
MKRGKTLFLLLVVSCAMCCYFGFSDLFLPLQLMISKNEINIIAVQFALLWNETNPCGFGGVLTTWGCVCGEDTSGSWCNTTSADLGPLYQLDKRISLDASYMLFHQSSTNRTFNVEMNRNSPHYPQLLNYLSWGRGREGWKVSEYQNYQKKVTEWTIENDPSLDETIDHPELQFCSSLNPSASNPRRGRITTTTTTTTAAAAGPTNQNNQTSIKCLSPLNKKQKFLLKLLKVYGPWTQQDVMMLHHLDSFQNILSDKLTLKSKKLFERKKWQVDNDTVQMKNKKHFKIGFIIFLSEDKHVTEFMTLLKTIWHPQDFYIIHVDKKIKSIMPQLSSDLKNYTNLKLYSEFSGQWADISLVYIEIISWIRLLESTQDIDYIINLSGIDFPIATYGEIQSLLYSFGSSRNLIDHSSQGTIGRYLNPTLLAPFHYATASFPNSIMASGRLWKKMGLRSFTAGSQWHILHRSFIAHLLLNPMLIEFLFSCKVVGIPDECFVPTSSTILSPDWNQNIQTTHTEWNSVHKNVTPQAFPTLMEMKTKHKKLFARKFWSSGVMMDWKTYANISLFSSLK